MTKYDRTRLVSALVDQHIWYSRNSTSQELIIFRRIAWVRFDDRNRTKTHICEQPRESGIQWPFNFMVDARAWLERHPESCGIGTQMSCPKHFVQTDGEPDLKFKIYKNETKYT
jgi:hypothetical protein